MLLSCTFSPDTSFRTWSKDKFGLMLMLGKASDLAWDKRAGKVYGKERQTFFINKTWADWKDNRNRTTRKHRCVSVTWRNSMLSSVCESLSISAFWFFNSRISFASSFSTSSTLCTAAFSWVLICSFTSERFFSMERIISVKILSFSSTVACADCCWHRRNGRTHLACWGLKCKTMISGQKM